MRYLKRAEALQPHDPLVRQNIAAAHLGLGEAERARELLEALVADAPTLHRRARAARDDVLSPEAEGRRRSRAPDRREAHRRGAGEAAEARGPCCGRCATAGAAFAGLTQELTCAGNISPLSPCSPRWRQRQEQLLSRSLPPNRSRRSQAPRHRPHKRLGPPGVLRRVAASRTQRLGSTPS